MTSVKIQLPHHHYEILIQPGLLKEAGRYVRDAAAHSKCALITDATVHQLFGSSVKKSLRRHDYAVTTHQLSSGEKYKTLSEIERAYVTLLDARLERKSPVVAFGGGVTGDMAGFIAATYLRGVPFIQMPTTLLAMVDASVGGKTGVNMPHGKNLIGAFYQPQCVLMDPLILNTLHPRDFRSGLAECIKHGVIRDESLFKWTLSNADKIIRNDPDTMIQLLKRNVQIKADVVMQDEKEQGVRAHLNYGHTFAHAIEATAGYGVYTHGEAVALGMVAAAYLAEKIRLAVGVCKPIEQAIAAVGLPIKGRLVTNDKLIDVMKHDKKAADDRIRLVLPDCIGNVIIKDDVSHQVIAEAWDYIRE